jgi:hypothetical protein
LLLLWELEPAAWQLLLVLLVSAWLPAPLVLVLVLVLLVWLLHFEV